MKVYGFASRGHYADHILPIYDALPDEARGGFFAPRSTDPWSADRAGLRVPADDGVVMVAADVDARRFTGRRVVYVEHGAGQVYDGDNDAAGHGSYSGGVGHGNTVLFVCPSETVADRWRAAYPAVPTAAVGCPKLDPWLRYREPGFTRRHHRQTGVVAFTFHWDNPLCPESRSALPHYQPHLASIVGALRATGRRVIGHGHPRAQRNLRRLWSALDVPYVPDLKYVLDHADVLVADNTSAMYEAAAVGINVVALNAPWYRRDVRHGLRFWDAIPGAMIDGPDALVDCINVAATGAWEANRQAVVARTYAYLDGHASDRAAAAIMEVIANG